MLSQLLLAIDTPEQKTKFENIFNKYNEVMLKIAFSYTKSQYDAEDAVYTVFFRIAQNIDDIKTDNEFMLKSYLYTSAKNAAINLIKEKNKNIHIETSGFSDSLPLDNLCDNLASDEKYSLIVKKITELPDIYRDVLVLHYLHEIPLKEIAKILKQNYNTIRTHLKRGNEILIKILEEEKNI